MGSVNKSVIQAVMQDFRAAGYLVFWRPRKRRISINGGADRPEAEAVAKMREILAKRPGT